MAFVPFGIVSPRKNGGRSPKTPLESSLSREYQGSSRRDFWGHPLWREGHAVAVDRSKLLGDMRLFIWVCGTANFARRRQKVAFLLSSAKNPAWGERLVSHAQRRL